MNFQPKFLIKNMFFKTFTIEEKYRNSSHLYAEIFIEKRP